MDSLNPNCSQIFVNDLCVIMAHTHSLYLLKIGELSSVDSKKYKESSGLEMCLIRVQTFVCVFL